MNSHTHILFVKRGAAMRWPVLACAASLLMMGLTGRGVGQENRYDWTGIDGNLQRTLEKHLRMTNKLPLEDMLKSFGKQFNLDIPPDALDIELSKEQIQFLQKMLTDLKTNGKISPDSASKLKEMQKLLTDGEGKFEELAISPKKTHVPPSSPPPGRDKKPPAAEQFDEDFSRWIKEQLEQAEDSEFGEMLRNSPAFKEAMSDIQRYLLEGGPATDWGVRDLVKNLHVPDWQVEAPGWWQRLPAWSPPELPRLNMRLPRLPRFATRLPSAPVSMPSLTAGKASALGETVLWLVLFAGGAFLVWQLVRRTLAERAANSKSFGPWPVEPAQVRTAAQLIAAFEYLSRLRFGAEARSWNHRTVAEKLAVQNASQRQAARELASLYALARYAPPLEPLSERAVDVARRHLCLLAEARGTQVDASSA